VRRAEDAHKSYRLFKPRSLASNSLSLEVAVQIAQQTAIGLAHLHQSGVYHQDIKPSNLLLTEQGIRIIDFNIAVSEHDEVTVSAGTRKYLPPDFKPKLDQTTAEKIDRDLYALGITFYECVTGCYPFEELSPPLGKLPRNPNEVQEMEELSDELVQILLKVIAPKKGDRFATAVELLEAIAALSSLRKIEGSEEVEPAAPLSDPIFNNSDIANPAQSIVALPVELPVEISLEQPEISKPQSGNSIAEAIDYASVAHLGGLIAAESSVQITLFDRLPPLSSAQSLSDGDRSPSKLVVLDPTGLYSPPSGCIEVRTEVEWMQSFFQSDNLYWVTGNGLQAKRLCDWTREWLRVWNKLDAILEEKQNPRARLQSLFGSVPIPLDWTDQQILQLATAIDTYPPENPIAYLLADRLPL